MRPGKAKGPSTGLGSGSAPPVVPSYIIGTSKRVVFADSPYTVLATDTTLLCDTTGGNIVLQLPAISVMGDRVIFAKLDIGSGTVSILPAVGETIDGFASYAINDLNDSVGLQAVLAVPSTKWQAIASYKDFQIGNLQDKSITYLSAAAYTSLVPFNAADWILSNVTVTPGSIAQTLAGGTHSAYRNYTGGFNDVGKGFYVKYKTTYQGPGQMAFVGVVNSPPGGANFGCMRTSGSNSPLTFFGPGGGNDYATPTIAMVVGTTYTFEVWYFVTALNNVTMTCRLWDAAGTTLLLSSQGNSGITMAANYGLSFYCGANNYGGELLDVKTYGLDTDTGGGVLESDNFFSYNEAARCLGIGTYNPAYALDVSGKIHAVGQVIFDDRLSVAGVASFTSAPKFLGNTASRPLMTDSSQNLATGTFTGTGTIFALSVSPTFTGTIGGANMVLTGSLGAGSMSATTTMAVGTTLTVGTTSLFSGVARFTSVPRFDGGNVTGAGAALLGANSPATTLTDPFTWITVTTNDGSTAYIPAWK